MVGFCAINFVIHTVHVMIILLFICVIGIFLNYICISLFACLNVNAGATNKPQELDDAVLRRLVSMKLLQFDFPATQKIDICYDPK